MEPLSIIIDGLPESDKKLLLAIRHTMDNPTHEKYEKISAIFDKKAKFQALMDDLLTPTITNNK